MKGKFNNLKDAVVHRAVLNDMSGIDWLGTPDGWYAFVPNFYGWDYLVHETEQGFVGVLRSRPATDSTESDMRRLYDLQVAFYAWAEEHSYWEPRP